MSKCHREFDSDFLYEIRDKEREQGNGKITPMNPTDPLENSFFCISRKLIYYSLFLTYRRICFFLKIDCGQ